MRISPRLKASFIAALAPVALAASAPTELSGTYGTPVIKAGEWRAYGKWTPSTRTLCIRGYNNGPGAVVNATLQTNRNYTVQAYGNDSRCWTIDPVNYVQPGGTLLVWHMGAGNNEVTQVVIPVGS